MTKLITAVRTMPDDMRETIAGVIQDLCALTAIAAFITAFNLWAPVVATAIN